MREDDYLQHDGLGLAAAVAAGSTTAAELLGLARTRAQGLNPRLNAIVRWMDAEADARVSEELTGAFAGVPFLLKDLDQDYAGIPTGEGSRAPDRVPDENATVVQRWLDAGLVVFGKTNTPEFGFKGVTEPARFGPTRNPWATDRTSGGSSGGAAAAVAAGILPVAGANDGGGSIRIPAACCGLFGLKPGRGLIPSGPAHGEPFHGAAINGVVSRSVRDTAAMLDVLAGPGPGAGYLPAAPNGRFLDEVGVDPAPLRIGVSTRSSIAGTPHPEALAAVEAATAALRALGHEVVAEDVGYDDAALAQDFLVPWFVRLAAQADASGGGAELEFDTRFTAAIGRATPALAYVTAVDRWHTYVRRLEDYHRRYDLLLTPTLARPPVGVGELRTPVALRGLGEVVLRLHAAGLLRHLGIVESSIRRNLAWVPYTQLANLTGVPAATVPLHWTADGVPLGVQFVAPLGGEGLLLRLAGQLERAVPWADRRPAL